jgi:hypothetical protein
MNASKDLISALNGAVNMLGAWAGGPGLIPEAILGCPVLGL